MKEEDCLTDTRLEMKASPLACKVWTPCPLSNVCGTSAQLIYSDIFIIFEVQQTRDVFTKWLFKLKFNSYIALVGELNVTLRGGADGLRSNSGIYVGVSKRS